VTERRLHRKDRHATPENVRIRPQKHIGSDPLLYRRHQRLAHALDPPNAGRWPHTATYRPWAIDVLVQFTDERRALAFERYLKSGSGCALAKRHLR
jgi:hypothetical protein